MDKDFVKDLGFLGVTARLKRLSDSISYSIKEMYKQQNIKFEPSWHLYILFLQEHPLSSMTEISESLKISLPAVYKVCNKLEESGLIKIVASETDKRKKCIKLTSQAENELLNLNEIWQAGSKAVADMLANNRRFLHTLENFENENDKLSFDQRVKQQLQQ